MKGNIIKRCGCPACRFAMRKGPPKAITTKILRAARHRWNLAARQGDLDKATAPISIPSPG